MERIVVFRGSPRKNGNTDSLTDIVVSRCREAGNDVTEFRLYDMEIGPCVACRACQKDWDDVCCAQKDDMQLIFDAVMKCDLLILATPIYSWYCTAPMKAMLDRLVYAMNMYYGGQRGPSLWAGKRVALITTCGYPPASGSDLFEEGMKRYCRHSQLTYEGMLCEQHLGYDTAFMDEEKQRHAAAFADKLCSADRLCPCCGEHFFVEKGAYEICPVCGWEDDPLQRRDPDFEGGANHLSLNEARRKYHEEA